MSSVGRTDELGKLVARLELLDRLCQSPAHIRDIIDETGQARSTVHRAVNELDEMGLVYRGDDGMEATLSGRFVRDQLVEYLDGLDDILTARRVLAPLPADTDIEYEALVGGAGTLAAPAPYQLSDRIHKQLTGAREYRALLPTLDESRTIRLLYEHVVTRGNPAELVVSESVFQTLQEDFPRRMAVLADEDHFGIFVGEIPPYTLGILQQDTQTDGPELKTHLVVHSDNGNIHGLIENETDSGVAWAADQYEKYRQAATDRTTGLGINTDGGIESTDGRSPSLTGQSLPASLEREGFARIDSSYFQHERLADPTTAWRAGISLPEVHTGYAISRLSADSPETTAPDFTDDIVATLVSGQNVLVLGPAGSGKSTACKQVACHWYETGRGPVIYRNSNNRHQFSAVDELVRTATATNEHTLVVVEDATRQGAKAVFEFLEQFDETHDVSVLLDSRETEWNAYLDRSGDGSRVTVRQIPPVRRDECERLADRFEQTTGRTIDLTPAQLYSAVRDDDPSYSSHGMLRLVHRLTSYADPLADDSTSLEKAVRAHYEEVIDDEIAGPVCVLIHALNVAGYTVDRSMLYASAPTAAYDAVDSILARLEGEVLFPVEDDQYETVHEEWSKIFLASLEADHDGSAVFGTVLTELLALADSPERCERISNHCGGAPLLETLLADPATWADDLATTLYTVARDQPKLTPLFGDGANDTVTLPSVCSEDTAASRPVWLGEGFLAGSFYDHAERAFERLPQTGKRATDRLLGLGRVAHRRGEYRHAIDVHENGVTIARENDDLEAELSHFNGLGLATWRLGSYETARDHFECCHERAHTLDGHRLGDRAHANLGAIAWSCGEYDRAAEHFQTFLDSARENGNRPGVAKSLNNLGWIDYQRGAYDRARRRFTESLAIRRDIGYRSGEASCLNNLGRTAARTHSAAAAVDYYESALEIAEAIGHSREVGNSLLGLGIVAKERGEYERATARFERATVVFDETGNQLYQSRVALEQADLASRCGDLSEAREQTQRTIAVFERQGESQMIGRACQLLGQIARAEGEFREAKTHLRAALRVFEANDAADLALETLSELVEICSETSDAAERERWCGFAQDCLDTAPDGTTARHREWVANCDTGATR